MSSSTPISPVSFSPVKWGGAVQGIARSLDELLPRDAGKRASVSSILERVRARILAAGTLFSGAQRESAELELANAAEQLAELLRLLGPERQDQDSLRRTLLDHAISFSGDVRGWGNEAFAELLGSALADVDIALARTEEKSPEERLAEALLRGHKALEEAKRKPSVATMEFAKASRWLTEATTVMTIQLPNLTGREGHLERLREGISLLGAGAALLGDRRLDVEKLSGRLHALAEVVAPAGFDLGALAQGLAVDSFEAALTRIDSQLARRQLAVIDAQTGAQARAGWTSGSLGRAKELQETLPHLLKSDDAQSLQLELQRLLLRGETEDDCIRLLKLPAYKGWGFRQKENRALVLTTEGFRIEYELYRPFKSTLQSWRFYSQRRSAISRADELEGIDVAQVRYVLRGLAERLMNGRGLKQEVSGEYDEAIWRPDENVGTRYFWAKLNSGRLTFATAREPRGLVRQSDVTLLRHLEARGELSVEPGALEELQAVVAHAG